MVQVTASLNTFFNFISVYFVWLSTSFGIMEFCFICNDKLLNERTCMCSSVTQHSKVSYPEKIVGLMGEEFVIIATPSDHMCRKCVSLLNHMDKMENDLKLVKNALLSFIHKKYGLLPTVSPANSINVEDDHSMSDEEQQVDQSYVYSRSKPAIINKSIDVDDDHSMSDEEQVHQINVFNRYKPTLINKTIDVEDDYSMSDEEQQVDQSYVYSRSKPALINKSIDVDDDYSISDEEPQVDQSNVYSRSKLALMNKSIDVDDYYSMSDEEQQVDQSNVYNRYKPTLINKSIDVDDDYSMSDEEQVDQSNVYNRYKPTLINKSIDVDDDHLISDEEPQIDQNKVSNGEKDANEKQICTTSIKMKSQNTKIVLYKCSLCPLQLKEIGFVRTHTQCHRKETTNKKLRKLPPNYILFKCILCNSYFETQLSCLRHIEKNHKGVHSCLFNEMVKENYVSPTINPSKTLMMTKKNCKTLLSNENGGQKDNQNGENASGHEQERTVNIDIQSLLAAMQGN